MNVRRLAPVFSAVGILGLWGGAFLMWGRSAPTDALAEQPGTNAEVKQKIDALKASVLGKNEETRGNKVVAPMIRAPKAVYDYTPREVCLQMKNLHPDQYEDVDCSSDKYSSPDGWRWTPGMDH